MSSDDDTGSIRIPSTAAAIGERINTEVKRVRRAERWIGKLTGFGVASMSVGLLTVMILATLVVRGPIPEHWRQTINALGLALFIAGVAAACSGLSMSFARRHVQLAKLEQAFHAVEHQADVGQLAAQLEKVAYNQTEIRAAIAANERQRTADLDQLRETSRKAIESLHQEIERIAGSIPQLIANARAEDRAELQKVMEEALKKERAAGYVAGVEQRLNGSSGTVVAFPKT